MSDWPVRADCSYGVKQRDEIAKSKSAAMFTAEGTPSAATPPPNQTLLSNGAGAGAEALWGCTVVFSMYCGISYIVRGLATLWRGRDTIVLL